MKLTPCTSTIPAKLGIAVGIARFAKRSTTSPAQCAWPRPSRDHWLTVLEGHHLEVIRLGGHCPSTSSWCFASQLLVPMCVDGMLLFDEQRGDRPAQTTEQGKRCRELLESRIHPAGFLARCTGTFCLCRSGGAANMDERCVDRGSPSSTRRPKTNPLTVRHGPLPLCCQNRVVCTSYVSLKSCDTECDTHSRYRYLCRG